MGKNLHGGAGHKKFARKHNVGSKSNKLRLSENAGESYAIVTKMLGNGMFHCHCIDNVARLGHIRGKFSLRKRDNMVEIGKWVLIGLREWDVQIEKASSISKNSSAKIQQCDLLEVYADMDKIRLKELVSEDWSILEHNDVSRIALKESREDDVVFAGDRDIEHNRLVQEMKSTTAEKITLKIEKKETDKEEEDEDDDVKVDDI